MTPSRRVRSKSPSAAKAPSGGGPLPPGAASVWYFAPWVLGPYDRQIPGKGEVFEAIVIDYPGERRGSALFKCTSEPHVLPGNGVVVEVDLLAVEDDTVGSWARGFFSSKPRGVHFCQVAAQASVAQAPFPLLHVG